VKIDRARVQIGRISRFGLLEMSRQRLKPSLGESTQIVCPRCTGHGTIRTVESLALSLIRIMEEEALKENSVRVDVHVPVDVATYMLNEKRKAINEIEQQTGIKMLIIANTTLETPQYRVERLRKGEIDEAGGVASYQQVVDTGENYDPADFKEKAIQPEQPAVTAIVPSRPVPLPVAQPTGGLLTKIVSLFTGDDSKGKGEDKEKKAAEQARRPAARSGSGGRGKGQAQAQAGQARRRGGRKPAQGQKGAQRSEQQRKQKSAQKSTQQTGDQQGGKTQKETEARTPAKDSKDQSTENKPRSRGRRGGRGRRGSGKPRQAEAQQANESQGQPVAEKQSDASAQKPASEPASMPQNKDAPAPKSEAKDTSVPAAETKNASAPTPAAKEAAVSKPQAKEASAPKPQAADAPASKPQAKDAPKPESKPETAATGE